MEERGHLVSYRLSLFVDTCLQLAVEDIVVSRSPGNMNQHLRPPRTPLSALITRSTQTLRGNHNLLPPRIQLSALTTASCSDLRATHQRTQTPRATLTPSSSSLAPLGTSMAPHRVPSAPRASAAMELNLEDTTEQSRSHKPGKSISNSILSTATSMFSTAASEASEASGPKSPLTTTIRNFSAGSRIPVLKTTNAASSIPATRATRKTPALSLNGSMKTEKAKKSPGYLTPRNASGTPSFEIRRGQKAFADEHSSPVSSPCPSPLQMERRPPALGSILYKMSEPNLPKELITPFAFEILCLLPPTVIATPPAFPKSIESAVYLCHTLLSSNQEINAEKTRAVASAVNAALVARTKVAMAEDVVHDGNAMTEKQQCEIILNTAIGSMELICIDICEQKPWLMENVMRKGGYVEEWMEVIRERAEKFTKQREAEWAATRAVAEMIPRASIYNPENVYPASQSAESVHSRQASISTVHTSEDGGYHRAATPPPMPSFRAYSGTDHQAEGAKRTTPSNNLSVPPDERTRPRPGTPTMAEATDTRALANRAPSHTRNRTTSSETNRQTAFFRPRTNTVAQPTYTSPEQRSRRSD